MSVPKWVRDGQVLIDIVQRERSLTRNERRLANLAVAWLREVAGTPDDQHTADCYRTYAKADGATEDEIAATYASGTR